jgi:hypothetical protein
MNSQTNSPRRSRPAPDPDYTQEALVEPEAEPVRGALAVNEPAPAPMGGHRSRPQRSEPTIAAPPARVIVTDIHMSFWAMVEFMVKLAFATIPAAIIITICVVLTIVFVGRLAGMR